MESQSLGNSACELELQVVFGGRFLIQPTINIGQVITVTNSDGYLSNVNVIKLLVFFYHFSEI